MSFALSFLQSSPGIISERCSGLWNRLLTCGVTRRQLLFFHFFEALLISFIQYCELVVYILFELKAFTWNFQWDLLVMAILLIFLNGISGIAAGILTSLLSRTVTESIYAGQMVMFPSLFLCGEQRI